MPTGNVENWADLLKVLAHPTRLAILSRLLQGLTCVNDIAELLGRAQPNVSQHLMALRAAGLVECRQSGLFRCYYLTRPAMVKDLLHVLARPYPRARPDADDVARAVRSKHAKPRTRTARPAARP